ncbi:MAG: FHA domain-containing protein [Deltaproteobacteria bacterium]|nr:FHA domain-containing protein [Deltaproteobacteria bacterium]
MGDQAAYIVIQGPGHNDTRFALREGITSFGRLPSNDVILLGDLVSRHHARIIFFDGKASLQDLGSHNGSWVNEEKITTRALTPGDVMRVGNFRITFHKGQAGLGHEDFTSEATRDDGAATIPPRLGTRLRTVESSDDTERHAPAAREVPPPDEDSFESRRAGQSSMVRELGQLASAGPGAGGVLLLLYRLTEALSHAESAEQYFEAILRLAIERVPAQAALLFRASEGEVDPVRVGELGPAVERGHTAMSMSVVRWAVAKHFTVYSKDLASDLRFRHGRSVADLAEDQTALVCSPIAAGDRVLGALYLARSSEAPFTEAEVDVVEAICHLSGVGINRIEGWQEAIEESLTRRALARAHSPDVVERLLREPKEHRFLEAHTAAICYAGIQGFSAIAEQLPPEEVSAFLSAYLDQASERVFAHRGTFYPLLGDELVAVFGAPYSYGNDTLRAVTAALDMRARFDRLVEQHPGLGPVRLSVGVSAGRLFAGAVGPARHLDYTVLGEPVRVAARLRSLAPPGTVLVSGSALPLINDRFEARLAGKKQLRPRHEAEDVFEVTGQRAGAVND